MKKEDVSCRWCKWYRQRYIAEDNLNLKFVSIVYSNDHGVTTSDNRCTCQHPTCFIVEILGEKFDPLNGKYVDFKLIRIGGHATLNARCDCKLYERTFVPIIWRFDSKDKDYLYVSIDKKLYDEQLKIFNEEGADV